MNEWMKLTQSHGFHRWREQSFRWGTISRLHWYCPLQLPFHLFVLALSVITINSSSSEVKTQTCLSFIQYLRPTIQFIRTETKIFVHIFLHFFLYLLTLSSILFLCFLSQASKTFFFIFSNFSYLSPKFRN